MEDNFITYKHYRTIRNTAIYVSECGGVMTLNPRGGRRYLKTECHICPAMKAKYISTKYPQIIFGVKTKFCVKTKFYAFYIHRLVASVWLRPKNLFEVEVDHLDGNIMNFHVLNLEWVTHEENIRRRWEAYYKRKAEKGGISK